MPNNNVAILSIMSKFDEKSAREAAKYYKLWKHAISNAANPNQSTKTTAGFH